jgi:hypothetical protein
MATVQLGVVYCLISVVLSAQTANTAKAMEGKVVAVHAASVSIATDEGVRTVQVSAETKIWRGHYLDMHQLKIGDYASVRYRVDGTPIAESIDANVDRWRGIITRVAGNRIEIAISSDEQGPTGTATITFDTSTAFAHGSRKDLLVGQHIELIGLVLKKNRMLATRVLGFEAFPSR